MKHWLITLSILALTGCGDPGTNKGYDAGYQLTCGFKWSPGNEFVVDKEFAYNFLSGARACAREHPKLAQAVLGLAGEVQAVTTDKANTQLEPTVTEEQQKAPAHAALPVNAAEAKSKAAKAPTVVGAPAETKSPAKSKAQPKAKASKNKTTPDKTEASAKTKRPPKAAAPVKPEAPAETKAPKKAEAPTKTKPPSKDSKAPATVERRSVSTPTPQASPVAETPKPRIPPKKPVNSYDSFMGE